MWDPFGLGVERETHSQNQTSLRFHHLETNNGIRIIETCLQVPFVPLTTMADFLPCINSLPEFVDWSLGSAHRLPTAVLLRAPHDS